LSSISVLHSHLRFSKAHQVSQKTKTYKAGKRTLIFTCFRRGAGDGNLWTELYVASICKYLFLSDVFVNVIFIYYSRSRIFELGNFFNGFAGCFYIMYSEYSGYKNKM
jgi:hypothetical protein